MQIDRRQFLASSLAAGAAMTLTGGAGASVGKSRQPLNLLMLGGTRFLGPATVNYALERGHKVTLFNRGRTNTHLFPDLEKLKGDRNDDLESLRGRSWDAVIDTSGYIPRHVRMTAELLADKVKQYLFVSSVSVYSSLSVPGLDETARVGTLEDPTVEEVTGETYGPLKALCEQAAQAAMPDRVAVVRPGLIVGPDDNTDRFTYWVARVGRGGRVLAPGDGSDYVQFVDVRDLGAFIVHCLEHRLNYTFNVDRSGGTMTMAGMLSSMSRALDSAIDPEWVPADFLAGHEVNPWSQMPVWLPQSNPEFAGVGQWSSQRAQGAGLKIRPAIDTFRDTLTWWQSQDQERRSEMRAGISAEKEAEVLKAWDARDTS